MTQISFDYKPWTKDDIMPERAGTSVGFAAINSAIEYSRHPANRQKAVNSYNQPVVDGVIELLAGSLEWLRQYGMDATEVQNRVRAYKVKATTSKSQVALKGAHSAIYEISDPRNVSHRIDPEKIPG